MEHQYRRGRMQSKRQTPPFYNSVVTFAMKPPQSMTCDCGPKGVAWQDNSAVIVSRVNNRKTAQEDFQDC